MPTAVVFDVQRFSLHDGPGIRTTVFFKGCPLRCAWCQNPESLRPQPELALTRALCRRAGDCVQACPRDAIDAGCLALDRQRCDGCGRCQTACAFGAWQLVGRRVEVEVLLDELERDRSYFESSGGGVTLSGGEPTLQMEAMGALARGARERGLSVGLQTAGAFSWERFAPHLGAFSFLHFDLKLMEAGEHRRLTGVTNDVILANARRLVEAGATVWFRAPVVPGATDTEDNLARMAAFLRSLGVPSLHLLCYHRMGLDKLPRLDFPIPRFDAGDSSVAERAVARAAEQLRAAGLEVTR